MKKKFLIVKVLVFIAIVAMVSVGFAWSSQVEQFVNVTVFQNKGGVAAVYGDLTVHFIDVGQADAIAVQFPNNKVMLVDAGLEMAPINPTNASRQAYFEYLNTYVFTENTDEDVLPVIDWFLITHSDSDHVNAAVHATYGVFTNFTVNTVYRPATFTPSEVEILNTDPVGEIYDKNFGNQWTSVENDTGVYAQFINATYAEDREVIFHQFAQNFITGGVAVDFYTPERFHYANTSVGRNSQCPYVVLTYRGKRIMLTGDAQVINQTEWLARNLTLKMDILKVAHHGGTGSNGLEFFDNINPTYAVISVGAGNSYGHPFQTVLDNLVESGVLPQNILRTDHDGTVIGYITAQGQVGIDTENDMSKQYERTYGIDGNEQFWFDYWMIALIIFVVSSLALFASDIVRYSRKRD